MQPFPVICETCHARLQVRSEAVIGHIVACPKCGSMVQIAPPADWTAADAELAATSAEPLPPPVPTLAERLSQPVALLAGGGAVVVLATVLAGVLWLRSDSDAAAPIHEPTAIVEAAAAPVAEAAPRDSRGEASLVSATPPAQEPTVTEPSESALPATTEAAVTETVEAITAPPPAATLQAAQPQPPIVESTPVSSAPAASTQLTTQSSLLDLQAPVRLGPMSSGSLGSRDVAGQLALPLESFEVASMPLSRLIETLSDLAAVPITLDPSALAMAGVAANQEVTVNSQDTTLAALLTDALAKHGLAYAEQDGQLIVIKPNADRRRSVDYELKDLVEPGDTDASRLAELIRQLVAPASWKEGGGSGTIVVDGTSLRVDQTDRVHCQILTFCERLRLARDLPLRSRYPADRLTVEPLYPQLETRLAKPATFTFLPWTRLADVFRQWETAAGVTVLVDWAALAQQELGPSSTVACSIVDRPWHAAFDAILAPLGLSWRAVDGRTIQITSREAAAGEPQIEFYPVAEDVLKQYPSPAAYAAALERELAGQFSAAGGNAPRFDVAFDVPSGCLIVLGSPGAQRYLTSRLDIFEPQRHEGHKE